MKQPEQRQVQATVESVAAARGDQVQIKAKIPEIGANQYGITLFIPEAAPHQAGETYTAVIQMGDLKDGKDGTRGTDYIWDAIEWAGRAIERGQRQAPAQQAPATAPSSPVQPRQPVGVQQGRVQYVQPMPLPPLPSSLDPRQDSIEAQVALKAAVDLVIANPPKDSEDNYAGLAETVVVVETIVHKFRRLLASPLEPEQQPEGNPDAGYPQDADAPTTDGEPLSW